ncbi:hypothetical protein [Actinoallomurus sp. NPDC052274]|uniref:hypothetical protein n=1 Tax=Actinoallomurus sp. NPDC052274 TaxID=3155420 RepID=UPI003431BA73
MTGSEVPTRPAITPEQLMEHLPTLLSALEDAAYYRESDPEGCRDCRDLIKEQGDRDARCGDHTSDDEQMERYWALRALLGGRD